MTGTEGGLTIERHEASAWLVQAFYRLCDVAEVCEHLPTRPAGSMPMVATLWRPARISCTGCWPGLPAGDSPEMRTCNRCGAECPAAPDPGSALPMRVTGGPWIWVVVLCPGCMRREIGWRAHKQLY
jgi:hypothetical protein